MGPGAQKGRLFMETFDIVYSDSESMEYKGTADSVYKKYGKEWTIRPLGNGNGNWLLTKRADILVNGKSYRKEVLDYYSKQKMTRQLFLKFKSDLESGKIKLQA